MTTFYFRKWIVRGVWLGTLLALAMNPHTMWAQGEQHELVIRGGRGELALEAPRFWLGIQGRPVDGTLKSQLKIDHGIAIESVVDDSPAAKAGLKAGDILLSVQGKPSNDVPDLFESLRETAGKPLALVLLREGKEQSLEVQPGERPGLNVRIAKADDPREDFLTAIPGSVRMLFVNPPVVWGALRGELPENVTITVTKHGKEPAQLVVKQGEETWQMTTDDLSKLPEEMRKLTEEFLNGAKVQVRLPNDFVPPVGLPGENNWAERVNRIFVAERNTKPAEDQHVDEQTTKVESEIRELRDQLNELRKSLEDLRNSKK